MEAATVRERFGIMQIPLRSGVLILLHRSAAACPIAYGSGRGSTRRATRRSSTAAGLTTPGAKGGWGFSPHTRKPAVYWSDNNGQKWYGPQLLHGPMFPGTDSGYGDLKRRRDGTFVAATYYCPPDKLDFADVEQYTFGTQRVRVMIETDRDGDGNPDANSGWRELYNGSNVYPVSGLAGKQWRMRVDLVAAGSAGPPKVVQIRVSPR